MNLTDDEVLKFQRGSPVLLDDICAIYSVTLGEIVDIGYGNFQQYLGILTATKPTIKKNEDEELNKLLEELTDFQYILFISSIDRQTNETLKEALRFFTRENDIKIILDPAQIVFGPLEEKHLLTEDKFYEFQSILRRMYFIEV